MLARAMVENLRIVRRAVANVMRGAKTDEVSGRQELTGIHVNLAGIEHPVIDRDAEALVISSRGVAHVISGCIFGTPPQSWFLARPGPVPERKENSAYGASQK